MCIRDSVEQIFLLQKNQDLRHSYEVVLLRPTLVADTLALLQLYLNIDQLDVYKRQVYHIDFQKNTPI